MGSENLEDIIEAKKKVRERIEAIGAESQKLGDKARNLEAEESRIGAALEGASPAEKDALLYEADELRGEVRELATGFESHAEELQSVEQELSRLEEGAGPAMEALRTAAIETETMFFEVFKLVATLALGSVIAVSAVSPALIPSLGTFADLWPAYRWLLVSLISSVATCSLLAFSIGMTRNPLRSSTKKGWLRRKMPDKVWSFLVSLVYSVMIVVPLFGLLYGLLEFIFFVGIGID